MVDRVQYSAAGSGNQGQGLTVLKGLEYNFSTPGKPPAPGDTEEEK
jgi:hypothetical protein